MSFSDAEQRRRIGNLVCVGRVVEVAKSRVRVAVDGMESDFIPVVCSSARGTSIHTELEVGEQVLVLTPDGEISHGFVLGAVYQKEKEPAGKHSMVFRDGLTIDYDETSKTLRLSGARGVVVNCEDAVSVKAKTASVTASESVSVVGKTVSIDGKDISLGADLATGGVVTTECLCAFTGKPHPDGSVGVRAKRL